MSSMASASDHVDHVRTQTPYALVCAGAAAAIGFIPAGFGLSPYLAIPIGVAGLAAVVWLYGKPVAAAPVTAPPISSEEQE
jgi:Na+/H+ antiporter NhaC